MSDDPSRLPPMGRATIHGEPDTVISSYAREEINATALVGHPAASRCSDDVGQGQGWQRNMSWTVAPICLPIFASGMATRARTSFDHR
jgi:hypothetical protein